MLVDTKIGTNAVQAPYQTAATSKGSMNGAVSSQWWTRPDDQRFLSLDDLYGHVAGVAEASSTTVFEANRARVVADKNDPEALALELPGLDVQVDPTHWSFGQMAGLVGAPAGYLRKLPAPIAAINLQYGLATYRPEIQKAYTIERPDGRHELRAATGADYGRIFDREVVDAVRGIAAGGAWKVPGTIDWSGGFGLSKITYDPNTPVTKQTTTLFASDRDVFIFLVDDLNPIEIGTLPDGSPDLVFRGFYTWNSEVGSKTCGIATMYLRGVCQNRMLWGVEGFQEISIRHSKFAPDRFLQEAEPALASYANASTGKLIEGIKAARDTIVAKDEDDRIEFLTGRAGLNKKQAKAAIDRVFEEEGHAPTSIWDMVQGITAMARSIPQQDDRVALERVAGKLLDKVAA